MTYATLRVLSHVADSDDLLDVDVHDLLVGDHVGAPLSRLIRTQATRTLARHFW